MLFITNRFPTTSIQTRLGRSFTFDLRNNAPSNSVFFCEKKDSDGAQEIGSKNFLSALKESRYKQIVIFIHGFSNLPDDVFENASKLQSLFDKEKDGGILVVPIIWPCDKDFGVVKDYWDDQKSADASAFSLSRVLSKFIEWRESNAQLSDDHCLKRINILAHSMGNRVLRETLCTWDKYDLPSGVPLLFRNTFLVAADIENESIHRTEKGKLISDSSRNVIVYYASDDLALRASKAANLKNKIASRRLGHTGPEDMELTPKNVYAVDCDDVNADYDNPKGHTYFLTDGSKKKPGLVFEHIFNCLLTGRVFPDDEFRRTSIIKRNK